jgi:hypothetical protein
MAPVVVPVFVAAFLFAGTPAPDTVADRPVPDREARFTATYMPVENPILKEFEAEFRMNRLLEQLAESLNAELKLPSDIDLALGECGVANSFYDPDAQRIIMCYELLIQVAADLAKSGYSDEELENFVGGTVIFFLSHELAHALIDLLDLPIVGREEDAADQLATVLLLEAGEDGEIAVAGTAVWFLQTSKGRRVNRSAYADEHSLGLQRYYNILCWVYGRDPGRHSDLVGNELLPRGRATRCSGEYQRMAKSWEQFLAPWAQQK